jgi:hypothetical protein
MAIVELEHFNYVVYIFEQLSPFVSYLIGNRGITYFHFVNEPVAQQETQILLYLGIAHIGAVHNLRLASAIFSNPEHVGYYLYIRPSPIHYSISLFSTYDPLLLYYPIDACQAPKYFTVRGDIICTIDTKGDYIIRYDKSLELNLHNQKGVLIKDVKLRQEVANG